MKLWAHRTTFCVTRYCEQQVGTACPPSQCGVLYVEHSNFKTVTMVSKMQTLFCTTVVIHYIQYGHVF